MGRRLKNVYFNTTIDAELLKFVDGLDNFSNWVKDKIRQEIQAQKTGIDPAVREMVEKLIETKLAGKVVTARASQEEVKDDILGDLERFF